jgi:hypothetical protein
MRRSVKNFVTLLMYDSLVQLRSYLWFFSYTCCLQLHLLVNIYSITMFEFLQSKVLRWICFYMMGKLCNFYLVNKCVLCMILPLIFLGRWNLRVKEHRLFAMICKFNFKAFGYIQYSLNNLSVSNLYMSLDIPGIMHFW